MASWFDRLFEDPKQYSSKPILSRLRSIVGGAIYRPGDLRGTSDIDNIRTEINVMRALYKDAQVNTAISYYATDATTPNTMGDIIWATSNDPNDQQVADIINKLFKRWKVNDYARSHIIELLVYGNLYIPTTEVYRGSGKNQSHQLVALDNNTIPQPSYDIIPSTIIPPEDIVHIWYQGEPQGYVYQNYSDSASVSKSNSDTILYPESSVIHFSLGGLLGKYTVSGKDADNNVIDYDIQFAEPMFSGAVQPTQTLSLLEDADLLSSLTRIVRIINVDCGNIQEENEIRQNLQLVKDTIEQQLALNTSDGTAQSFVNPQSPNNLIYVPKTNGADTISVTDLNIAATTEGDNTLLDYYQNKKLSVLGVPKEAMNFSSAEGLGGAGAVMSQRSALYSNRLAMVETAYMNGWRDAIDKYFCQRNMPGFMDTYTLHMNPIITNMDEVLFNKRDSAIGQANSIVDLLKGLGVTDTNTYKQALTETLTQALPQTGAAVNGWDVDLTSEAGGDEGGMF